MGQLLRGGVVRGAETAEDWKVGPGWIRGGRDLRGAEPRAYTQIEGEIRLIRTGNTAQNA